MSDIMMNDPEALAMAERAPSANPAFSPREPIEGFDFATTKPIEQLDRGIAFLQSLSADDYPIEKHLRSAEKNGADVDDARALLATLRASHALLVRLGAAMVADEKARREWLATHSEAAREDITKATWKRRFAQQAIDAHALTLAASSAVTPPAKESGPPTSETASVFTVWSEYDDMSGQWALVSIHSDEASANAAAASNQASKSKDTYGETRVEEWKLEGP